MKISIKPAQPIMLLEDITEEEVCAWLKSRGSQEFARHSVKDDEDRREVAKWFITAIRDLYVYKSHKTAIHD